MPQTEELVKLAEELVAEVDSLTAKNIALQEQCELAKKASAEKVTVKADEKLASAVCEHLVRIGSIAKGEEAIAKKAFIEDPNAALRCLEGFLLAEPTEISKKASLADVSGGETVGKHEVDKKEDVAAKLYKILR
jgi:hypothetical protein